MLIPNALYYTLRNISLIDSSLGLSEGVRNVTRPFRVAIYSAANDTITSTISTVTNFFQHNSALPPELPPEGNLNIRQRLSSMAGSARDHLPSFRTVRQMTTGGLLATGF